jgi:hypothetical protein
MTTRSILKNISIQMLVISLIPSVAFAYVDPNTGGYVFQVLFPILSAAAAIFVFFKRQVSALLSKIAGLFSRKSD